MKRATDAYLSHTERIAEKNSDVAPSISSSNTIFNLSLPPSSDMVEQNLDIFSLTVSIPLSEDALM